MDPEPEIEINIDAIEWNSIKNLEQDLTKCINHVLKFLKINYHKFEVSVLLTSDEKIQQLNLEYRNQDKPTNVLSFQSEDVDFENLKNMLSDYDEPYFLGDIAISYDRILIESIEQNKSFSDHLHHIFTHGILHLLGFDHEIQEEAEVMESIEIAILKIFNISNPYTS